MQAVEDLLKRLPAWAQQFSRYLLCGGTAFLIHWVIVNLLGHTLNPAFAEQLGDQLRFERSALNNSCAFLISNTVAYLLNVRFVFESGRHQRRTEVGLFFIASAIGFFPALYSLDFIIRTLSLNTHVANLGFPAVAAVGNFFARKFLIFRR